MNQVLMQGGGATFAPVVPVGATLEIKLEPVAVSWTATGAEITSLADDASLESMVAVCELGVESVRGECSVVSTAFETTASSGTEVGTSQLSNGSSAGLGATCSPEGLPRNCGDEKSLSASLSPCGGIPSCCVRSGP